MATTLAQKIVRGIRFELRLDGKRLGLFNVSRDAWALPLAPAEMAHELKNCPAGVVTAAGRQWLESINTPNLPKLEV